jgi:hypothetical protein
MLIVNKIPDKLSEDVFKPFTDKYIINEFLSKAHKKDFNNQFSYEIGLIGMLIPNDSDAFFR